MTPKIFQIISKTAFILFVILFVSAIFLSKNQRASISGFLLALFFTTLIFEVVYQLSSGLKERENTKKKKKEFKKLPDGNYRIRDKKSNAVLGILTADEINFLRKKFLDNGMDDNNFYFDPVTFKLFKNENPPRELCDKIKKMLEEKEQIEIVWEK